jgi:hypothetical protein
MPKASLSYRVSHTRLIPIYRVPDRRTPLLRHIPAGRTLHVIDIENLMAGPRSGIDLVRTASAAYRDCLPISTKDLVIVAANPGLAIDVAREWKGSQVKFRKGPDGADLALLEYLADVDDIVRRFDRVVIGSGDGIFAAIVNQLRSKGIVVGVIGRSSGISRILAHSATFVARLDRDCATKDAA